MRTVLAAVSILALAACGMEGTDRNADDKQAGATASADNAGSDNLADSMASQDPPEGEPMPDEGIEDSEERPIMQAQVILDRQGFGPGVIDGAMGMSTKNALLGFQEANDLETSGELDEATKEKLARWDTIPATRVVTIPADWAEIEFDEIPEDTAEKAELEQLAYTTLDEKLAERFHTTVAVLKELNPNGKPAGWTEAKAATPPPGSEAGASDAGTTMASSEGTQSAGSDTDDEAKGDTEAGSFFAAGQQIRVPNIGADRIAPAAVQDTNWQKTLQSLGVGTDQPEVDRIVVSKAGKTLKAYQGDKLVALFTVSSGSSEFPLPIGNWDIVGEAFNPPYRYDPEVLGSGDGKVYQLPPGPNNPVGVVWIDLSKEHYGIHGTPEPETIGRAQSSGCVRLTNWDAARLAQMVSTDTKVIFEA